MDKSDELLIYYKCAKSLGRELTSEDRKIIYYAIENLKEREKEKMIQPSSLEPEVNLENEDEINSKKMSF